MSSELHRQAEEIHNNEKRLIAYNAKKALRELLISLERFNPDSKIEIIIYG
jgi:hypothetical protein